MRVLVTGGAGFIGSHLVDALMARGDSVTVLDDFSEGRRENLRPHLGDPGFRLIEGDIRDEASVEKAMSGVVAVIHQAAMKSVPLSMKKPELAHDINVRGTLTLLEKSLDAGVEKFVFASTCAIYGDAEEMPIREDTPPNPLSPYAESKLMAERSCLKFYDREKLPAVSLRYFNAYGPRQLGGAYAGVMSKFIERLRNNRAPVIYGDGEQTRDFIHVKDLVEATLLALDRSGVEGEAINIGTMRRVTINELCRIFIEISGKRDLKPIYEPARPGDIRHSQADISKARKLLKFRPKISIERGVEMLWNSWGG
jgi:UDP-glucose 4-epimerase